ncbi:MAG: sulfotransferase domain-containing protein [Ignavibacteriales bacterium]
MPALQRAATLNYRTATADSARWDAFEPREGDIVIATFAKCGTTWTQRIVDLLVHQDAEPRPVGDMSPWLDARFFAPLEDDLATLAAQKHRRFIKSHLPFNALPVYDGVKYIHVARDGRDAFMSWHNHVMGFRPEWIERLIAISEQDPALTPMPRMRPPEDPHLFFQGWIATAEAEPPEGPGRDMGFFDFEATYWRERHRENLLFVHYNDLKADLKGEMRRISEFLEIDTPDDVLDELVAAAGFDAMKKHGAALVPVLASAFDKGAERFLNKGSNGRWRDALTADDVARYQAAADRKLSSSHLAWIERGRLLAGDPRAMAD